MHLHLHFAHTHTLNLMRVQSYLNHAARKFAPSYDANCYLLLSRSMDLMDLGTLLDGNPAAEACGEEKEEIDLVEEDEQKHGCTDGGVLSRAERMRRALSRVPAGRQVTDGATAIARCCSNQPNHFARTRV